VGTKDGARHPGAENQIGALLPGHEANFLVLDEDPSVDIHKSGSN
jgi:imidazolonepropionase-like amidohydrolase